MFIHTLIIVSIVSPTQEGNPFTNPIYGATGADMIMFEEVGMRNTQ